MDLTRKHLKELQRQLNEQNEGALSTLSDSRINLFLLSQQNEPLEDPPEGLLLDDSADEKDDAVNSSMENFEDGDDDDIAGNDNYGVENTSRSLLTINDTQLNEAPVKFQDENGLSKIFDPNNTSLLYVEKKELQESSTDVKSTAREALKSIDTNTSSSPIKSLKQGISKLPVSQAAAKTGRVLRSRMLNAPGLPYNMGSKAKQLKQKQGRTKSTKTLNSKSPSDLNFPKMDSLISLKSKERFP
ncbi:hypothetical protein BN7_4289 [Wickerhamomyces ciferrii]|uniref:Uncharacterized protein n=1 Tax=Wickerhamomyces ciferrii (strain ATCC 14091 / BCRC 22168 / CBS 111 / JCM 3599 / NBRC 0793 / NRRL Y-1031 F-60-10) TaxID=1206466 RepID=K0KP43_WICCF|nr:uncharacterized protein BN7_4289 [Wickerhamomyces ciferrii]CCH44721.1 hypothetical protein BN7_4289 [Wickerhamomyces ciferrii]